jgi:hypothetical protein
MGCAARGDAAETDGQQEQAKKSKSKSKSKSKNGNAVKREGVKLEQVVGTPDLAVFAQRIEDLVASNDRIGLRETWASMSDLSGCKVQTEQKHDLGLSTFLLRGKKKLDRRIHKSLSRKNRGPVISVSLDRFDTALPGPETISGEHCQASTSGRVTLHVNPPRHRERIVTHVFDATFASGEWVLVAYSHESQDCSSEDQDEEHAGCTALAKLAPESPKKTRPQPKPKPEPALELEPELESESESELEPAPSTEGE